MSEKKRRQIVAPQIRIGPAGWSYKDWEGVVYPKKPGTRFDPLEYISRFFDTVEINSSFYRPPSASTAASWAKRVAQNRRFTFTAKLHRVFTHERGKATAADEKAFREGVEPLAKAGKLGALLLQFPWSFKNEMDERNYLNQLVTTFKDYPLVVEVRHVTRALDHLDPRLRNQRLPPPRIGRNDQAVGRSPHEQRLRAEAIEALG